MSGTRSLSRKAQATDDGPRSGAIIVSHGQPSDPGPADRALKTLAGLVAAMLPEQSVQGASLAAPGSLQQALDHAGPSPVIYPFFMTGGWFTQTALPKRVNRPDARFLQPFGQDPDLPELVARRLTGALVQRGMRPEATTLLLAAHGSGRSRQTSKQTASFAAELANHLDLSAIRIGYIEEDPRLSAAAQGIRGDTICLPFFAAPGGHVEDDIPAELAKAGYKGDTLPPVGAMQGVGALIARALRPVLRQEDIE